MRDGYGHWPFVVTTHKQTCTNHYNSKGEAVCSASTFFLDGSGRVVFWFLLPRNPSWSISCHKKSNSLVLHSVHVLSQVHEIKINTKTDYTRILFLWNFLKQTCAFNTMHIATYLWSLMSFQFKRISYLNPWSSFQTFFHKFVVYFFLHKRARTSTTNLTTVCKYSDLSHFHSIIHCN